MFVIIWLVVLADIWRVCMCSDWLTGQLKDPKTKQKDKIRKTMAVFQKIVAT